jgi:ribosomal RNA-processing protein 1
MWMSDKPLVQEELAEDLGSLIHCFPDIKVGIKFFRNFLETMCLEWFGIDQWRIDKFMMVSVLQRHDLDTILNLGGIFF